jgi:organic hydroperoxide reductase OsmC/OhrA
MQDFPHLYTVTAAAGTEGDVVVEGATLPPLMTSSPPQFGGPSGRWSPEALLVAAVADCYILSFRAIAKATKLPWDGIECAVSGTLDRIEKVTQFTEFHVRATLRVPPGTDEAKARAAMERAEQICLITNSLKGQAHLDATVEISGR